MTQSDLFAWLGAPLANVRWSWGAVRPGDGAVFLRVWRDRMRRRDGVDFVQVTHNHAYLTNQKNPGYRERQRHVDLVRAGAPSYLVMCEVVDPEARPRKIAGFDTERVYPGGRLIEEDGEFWLEVLSGVPAEEVAARSQ